jgi:branched-chain amino acid transport system substrate-binding protein
VRMVAGHFCSNAATAAAAIYAERDVVMITPSASLPKLTEPGFATTFRLAPRDDNQGALAAQRISVEVPQGLIALIEDGTPASKALAASFSTVKQPDVEVTIKPSDRNLAKTATALAGRDLAAVYLATNGADAGILTAAYASAGGTAKIY